MKKIGLIAFVMLSFTGCQKIRDLGTEIVDNLRTITTKTSKEIRIKVVPKRENFTQVFDLKLTDKVKEENQEIKSLEQDVEDLYLKEASLELVSGLTLQKEELKNLDFLDSIIIRVVLSDTKKIEFAKNLKTEKGKTIIELTPTDKKLDILLKKNLIKYEVEYSSNKVIRDFKCKLNFKYQFKARV